MNNGTVPHAKRLLWAGFFSIFAAGVGFGVRGGILVDWAREYGFTAKELGDISGGGLWGFGVIIILGSLIADRVGYGTLMVVAFLMHVLSAILQMGTGVIYDTYGSGGVYWSLTVAMVMFSVGNGLCEVVVNPMVAALFPNEKTHYLNILHAGWPGGLIAGGVVGYVMNDIVKVHWIVQMSMFLIPVVIYGVMLLGQHLPTSEAGQAGVSYTTMLAEFLAPVLLLLLVIHAMVGYVELGTDNWIQKITGTITDSRGTGVLLFIYTNILMFSLRFFAGPIAHSISPLGLLFASAVIATVGLLFLGYAEGALLCLAAVTVYGVGKTFFWPTMLAVVSERFPRGGALTLGAVGGVGMLSAGFLGGPGIGFKQDYNASNMLRTEHSQVYDHYKAADENIFLGFKVRGLDGSKVGILELGTREATTPDEAKFNTAELNRTLEMTKLGPWWEEARPHAQADKKPVDEAILFGSRRALLLTAAVPAAMAVLYLLLILYFKATGGYTRVEIDPEKLAGGVEGPVR